MNLVMISVIDIIFQKRKNIFMNQSFKMSDTTFVMPLQFTKLIWASLIGIFLFSEIPDYWTWLGAIIIFISVIYITYRESFVKKDNPEKKQIDRAIIN